MASKYDRFNLVTDFELRGDLKGAKLRTRTGYFAPFKDKK